jgi:hypothetical protein
LTGTLFEVIVTSPRDALDKLTHRSDIGSAQVFGDRLHVWIDRTDSQAAAALLKSATESAGLAPSSVRPIVPSLEDVFIARLAAEDARATEGTESSDRVTP